MTTDLIAKRDALLATQATDTLLDMLDVIQAGPRNGYGVLASAEHRTVSLWLIEEVERRHPDAVDYVQRPAAGGCRGGGRHRGLTRLVLTETVGTFR